ncbi:MAG: DUF5060 domain-containing protein [Planctomycetota bacterium]
MRLLAGALFCLLASRGIAADEQQYFQYQPIKLDFELASTHELAPENPFLDYRLDVTFSQGGRTFRVPGHFAADGDAANSGASHGTVWRVLFAAPEDGEWTYEVSFHRGRHLAIDEDPYRGEPVAPHDGTTGTLQVQPVPATAKGFHRSGGLVYADSRYLHTRDQKPLLLFGPNSPENLLAYRDFDGTYSADPGKQYLKSWSAHGRDWRPGDLTWGDGRGKGLVGGFNYLASEGMNVVYALTFNVGGDGCDVWPFVEPNKQHFTRYDVSKLAQWDVIFSHAESLGIVMELITQEQENQLLLDDGELGVERRLYYRELISRFGHHGNLIWNIGEENGGQGAYWPQGQDDAQRFAMIRYLKDHDPYKHPVMMHTYATAEEREPIVSRLLRFDKFDGLSMQCANTPLIHDETADWIERSEQYDRPWIVMQGEIGPWHIGTAPDEVDPSHDQIRKEALWGALMAGAAGAEWYFGWLTSPNDLDAEDWRSRENMWRQSRAARDFFQRLDYTRMRAADQLVSAEEAHCFCEEAKTYAIYLPNGGTTRLDLRDIDASFDVKWYAARTGGELQVGSVETLVGGTWVNLGNPPADPTNDWAILVTREEDQP